MCVYVCIYTHTYTHTHTHTHTHIYIYIILSSPSEELISLSYEKEANLSPTFKVSYCQDMRKVIKKQFSIYFCNNLVASP